MSSLLEVTPSTIVARLASGDLKAASVAEINTLLGIGGVTFEAVATALEVATAPLILNSTLATGALTGDLVLGNAGFLRFINNAGTTSANYGIGSTTGDNLTLNVPAATDTFDFDFAGTNKLQVKEENAGAGILFIGESSTAQSLPAANNGVIYTKDISAQTHLYFRNTTAENWLSAWVDTASSLRPSVNGRGLQLNSSGGLGTHILNTGGPGVIFNEQGNSSIDFRVESSTLTHAFFVDAGTDNVLFGGTTSASNAKGHLHIYQQTSPTNFIAGGITLGSKDSSVGTADATVELWLETAPIAIGTFTASHKFPIWINGTEYHIQLDAV